ncbi:type II toxin-antitoxin system RelB/DinJ family antitoxin [Erysipelotrichaceae bacterium 51-3]
MAQISIQIGDSTKRDAERICSKIGLSLSTAINIYLKKIVNENGIPLELTADPFYSKKNMDRLRASIHQMETTGRTVHQVDFDD